MEDVRIQVELNLEQINDCEEKEVHIEMIMSLDDENRKKEKQITSLWRMIENKLNCIFESYDTNTGDDSDCVEWFDKYAIYKRKNECKLCLLKNVVDFQKYFDEIASTARTRMKRKEEEGTTPTICVPLIIQV